MRKLFALRLLSTGCASAVLAGCAVSLAPLQRNTAGFATGTITVTNSSANAYRAANRLHEDQQLALAVLSYDKRPAWNPADYAKPLLTPTQLAGRLAVLDALKQYAETLAGLGATGHGKDLDATSSQLGSTLQGLSLNVATVFATAIPGAPTLSDNDKTALSAGLVGLGNLLDQRLVRRQLPKVLQQHDPDVAAICNALDSDVEILRRQADRDFGTLEEAQDQYIRDPASALAGSERRTAIARLPTLVREQQENDDLLARLQTTLRTLARTHHALTVAAQGNRSPSIDPYLEDLAIQGQALAALTARPSSPPAGSQEFP